LYAAVNNQMPGNHEFARQFMQKGYPQTMARLPDASLERRVSI
jgi:hypothetical protein